MGINPTLIGMAVFLLVFIAISALGFVRNIWAGGDRKQAISRLRSLSSESAADPASLTAGRNWAILALPKLGAVFLSKERKNVADLQTRLLRAGFFRPSAVLVFVGLRPLLMLGLALGSALTFYGTGWVAPAQLPLVSLVGCGVGLMGPSFWLDWRVSQRQRLLRNGIPDALDMLVLCVEGGISLQAALQRVTDELHAPHPVLAIEMNIIQREVELGLSPGAAFKKFGNRCGLPDVRDLASILQQSERFGASVTKALRTYADWARAERQMRAEEIAQKAAVKILFPTLLCIFPAIFVVLLGPAAFQLAHLFAR
jgi:tight adherence protein C